MRKIEVKQIGATSAFKASVYFAIIPCILMLVLGIFITIIGVAIGQPKFLFLGIPYIVFPIFVLGLNGLFTMLSSFIYNKLTQRFGGLELVIDEKDEIPPNYAQPYYAQQNYEQPNSNQGPNNM